MPKPAAPPQQPQPARPRAAHVEAAVSRTAQAKPAAPARPVAPHVQAVLGATAQARRADLSPRAAAPVVQRAARREKEKDDEDPYRKTYSKPQGISSRPTRKAKLEHSTVRPKKLTARQERIVGVVTGSSNPGYSPAKDRLGNKVWDGRRSGLSWFDNVEQAMAGSKGGGCQLQKVGCTGGADGIDHVTDFADLQSGLERYVICDGLHHFAACYKDDALELYNGGNAKTTPALSVDVSNFVWACTSCNSSKGGKKGVYENVAKWLKKCPDLCGYSFKGEESSD